MGDNGNKYVVFKRDELFQFLGKVAIPGHSDHVSEEIATLIDEVNKVAVPDAVVIRRQDAFAPPALDAYANSIDVALEVSKQLGDPTPEAMSLRGIADYFHAQAQESWDCSRKLPD